VRRPAGLWILSVPADRLDAVAKPTSPGPCAGPGERNHRPDQLVHLGLLRLGQGALPRRCAATCAPPRWRGRLSSTGAWRFLPRTTSGAGAAARPGLRRRAAVDVRREPQAHRARDAGRAPRRAAPLAITPSDRTSKREVEPARKRERVAASLREDPLSHALVEWPFVPILPRSCCWAERRPRARASWVIANRCRRVARRRSS
jgi:hypothetical protein